MTWVIVGVGTAAISAAASIKSADSIRGNADLTNSLNQINAKYADVDAWEAEKFGHTQQAKYQTTIDQTVGAQRAGFSAEGVDVNFGTAAAVQAETKLTGYLNQLDMQKTAHAKALGFTREADSIRSGSQQYVRQADMNANATETTGVLGAASQALSIGRYQNQTGYNAKSLNQSQIAKLDALP